MESQEIADLGLPQAAEVAPGEGAGVLDYAGPAAVVRRRFWVVVAVLVAVVGCPVSAVIGAIIASGGAVGLWPLTVHGFSECVVWGGAWGVPGGLAIAIVAAESRRFPLTWSVGGCAGVGLFSGGLLFAFISVIG